MEKVEKFIKRNEAVMAYFIAFGPIVSLSN